MCVRISRIFILMRVIKRSSKHLSTSLYMYIPIRAIICGEKKCCFKYLKGVLKTVSSFRPRELFRRLLGSGALFFNESRLYNCGYIYRTYGNKTAVFNGILHLY